MLPAVNWLAHALAEDVGQIEWKNGQTIKHPIPPGPTIVLKDSREYQIACDSLETRELLIHLAKFYQSLQDENNRLHQETIAVPWRPASDLPPGGEHSSIRRSHVLVTSPVLQYILVNGVCDGFYDHLTSRWFAIINGKTVEHRISHWRFLPPAPNKPVPYNQVKEEVEGIIKFLLPK